MTDKTRRSREDEFFARLEFEKLAKKKHEEQRKLAQAEREKLKKLHYLKCPKCGMDLVEIEVLKIKVDKCSNCLGIYLDHGELEQIIEGDNKGLLDRIVRVFKD